MDLITETERFLRGVILIIKHKPGHILKDVRFSDV
jgi:hypothetical protein